MNCPKVENEPKYDLMGVSPRELFYRQQGLCWLEAALDEYDGKKHFGTLYCTDGKEYADTASMTNPTFECVVCLVSYIRNLVSKENVT